ncbi:RNA-binding protein 48 [Epargyreus clarus]|uniref:RNA-binding protein 48 n=1 Tax=Epargyreus clarus TaxID=520877 RepID=UPI003C2DBD4C
MENEKDTDKILLPHHEQQELCATRLPYRQGRKLTAVKVYSITKESNHLLIFGVPSLNLRQEAKALFIKFGKLLKFNISKDHASEPFTETYHAQYERIQCARLAKKFLDTKNFYGGSLHICYAPELENIEETTKKLLQRQKDVLFRLRNLHNEEIRPKVVAKETKIDSVNETEHEKVLLNMGEVNIIGTEIKPKFKRKIHNEVVIEKRFKPCFVNETVDANVSSNDNVSDNERLNCNVSRSVTDVTEVEIVDCTSVQKSVVSNINEALNYNKFGDETVVKIPPKTVNKIKFNVNKKTLI